MMQFITLILLGILHFITGWGILNLFKIQLKPALSISLSIITGIMVASFLPLLLQIISIPVSATNVFGSLILAALLLNIGTIKNFRNIQWPRPSFGFKMYELPSVLLLGFILFLTAWRCFYLPATPRDMLAGPETIAEYAAKEHTLINSVFTLDLWINNNPYKPPFLICLQLIYKLAGFPFGNVWLSFIVVSFFVFLYHALIEKIHPIIAGFILIFFLVIPEMFGYTFMVLYDYSNAVLFFLSFYFLVEYFKSKQVNQLYFSALLMLFATYIRVETFMLAAMVVPAILLFQYKEKYKIGKMVLTNGIFLAVSFFGYYLPYGIYNNYYLPKHYDVGKEINTKFFELGPLFDRFLEINDTLIFSEYGMNLYGYFFFGFIALLLAELVFKRKFSREGRNWLYSVAVIYFGLPVIGFILPLMDVANTTKRGMFKIFPLMVLYMGNNGLLTGLSNAIWKWEHSSGDTKPVPAPAKKEPQPVIKPKKK